MASEDAQTKSTSYLLPVEDTQFLLRDEMRATRFALEYAKAELRDRGIRSTIIVFGGSHSLSGTGGAGGERRSEHGRDGRRARHGPQNHPLLAVRYPTARNAGRLPFTETS